MTTTIRDITELQDRRIMMEKKLPPFGYALILLTAALMLFLVVWSTKNYRTYVSQSSGSVQAANKTYIMSSYSGSITELNIAEGSYVNEGDLIAHIKSTDLDMQPESAPADACNASDPTPGEQSATLPTADSYSFADGFETKIGRQFCRPIRMWTGGQSIFIPP